MEWALSLFIYNSIDFCRFQVVFMLSTTISNCPLYLPALPTEEEQAEYRMLLENNLCFKAVMTTGGHAVIKGTFQELSHKNNILQVEIDTDQTCFLSVIQDIENIKEKYGDV
ncbi:MAG: hypothetical protein NC307_10530 [Roseburia sp.]|nr:hypothetical protein [Roseburia sp.]